MDFMRIGDAERDEAVTMLREHHASGRLSSEEFDDRMTKALGAKTMSTLVELFTDLPEPRPGAGFSSASASPEPGPVYGYDAPGHGYAPAPEPTSWGYDTAPAPYGPITPAPYGPGTPSPYPDAPHGIAPKPERPWYAQWWMIFVAVGMGIVFDTGFPFILLMALWLWVIYPMVIEKRQAAVQAPATPPRPLTYSEREWVMEELRKGNKILAIKRYRELTGAGLKVAKDTIDGWGRQIGR